MGAPAVLRNPTMRPDRRLSVALGLAVAFALGCARCGSPPPPVERFVAADAAASLVLPTLEGFARQTSDVLATAGTFPFGKGLLDARSVIAGRLTFDPFDAAAISAAGLDPKRGLSLSGKVGERGPNAPDVVLTLPIGDAAKLEETFAKLARERLGATERTVEAGDPEVVGWRMAAGAPTLFAYAVVEQTALVSFGDTAAAIVRAAAAVPATATLASVPAYQQSMKALGDGLAMQFFVPAGSPALQELAQLKDGAAFGLRGAKDRLGLLAAMPLGAREAALKAALADAKSGALAAQLDPRAVMVARGEGASGSMMDPAELTIALAKQGIPASAQELVAEFVGSLGGSSAMALSVLPQTGKTAVLQLEPLRFFSAELLLSLKDPARMTAALQRAVDGLSSQASAPAVKGKKGTARIDLGKNPWRFPLPGGEVAAAVADRKLALAVGPKGTLEALLARTGSAFKGPTPASDQAFAGATGGLFLDVPRLVAGLKALPEAAYGEGQQAVMLKSMVDQYATASERITALSVRSDVVEGIGRGELLVEVRPEVPAPAAK